MRRLLATVRRTIAAAAHAGMALVNATARRSFSLLADLFRAIDAGTAVVIGYVKADGTASERVIEPAELRATEAGDITVRAYDRSRGEDRTFRVDRITDFALTA